MNNVKAILLALLGAWLLIVTRFAQHHHLTAEELERDAEKALEFERKEWIAGETFVEHEWSIVEGAVEREARLGAEAAKRVLERFEDPPGTYFVKESAQLDEIRTRTLQR